MSDNEQTILNVWRWQNTPSVHPLTCGNHSSHMPLVPVERGGRVVLICADCDYEQGYLPEFLVAEESDHE